MSVSIVHLVKGNAIPSQPTPKNLNGTLVPTIDSRLRPATERSDPRSLGEQDAMIFQGSIIDGQGFILTAEERADLLRSDPRNSARIFPLVGGEEVNTHPKQAPGRYVISFGKLTLQEAAEWPTLLQRVERTVRPQREAVRSNTGMGAHGKKYWWQFTARRDPLYAALMQVQRCLVTSQTAKHFCVSWQPTDRIFTTKVVVFTLTSHSAFSTMQSRVFEPWAWLLSSTMRADLSFTSNAFETFPFPSPNPDAQLATLEAMGERVCETRAHYMHVTHQGLTKTYNALKDRANTDAPVVALRGLHVELDRAVLAAYGWSDIDVPPFDLLPEDPARRRFTDQVLHRLFALNAERAAAQEARVGGRAGARDAIADPQ